MAFDLTNIEHLIDPNTGEVFSKADLIKWRNDQQQKLSKEQKREFDKQKEQEKQVALNGGFVQFNYTKDTFSDLTLRQIGLLFRLGIYVGYPNEEGISYIRTPHSPVLANRKQIGGYWNLDNKKTGVQLKKFIELGYLAEDENGYYFPNNQFVKGKVKKEEGYTYKRVLIQAVISLIDTIVNFNSTTSYTNVGIFVKLIMQSHKSNLVVDDAYLNSKTVDKPLTITKLAEYVGVSTITLNKALSALNTNFRCLTVLSDVNIKKPIFSRFYLKDTYMISNRYVLADINVFDEDDFDVIDGAKNKRKHA